MALATYLRDALAELALVRSPLLYLGNAKLSLDCLFLMRLAAHREIPTRGTSRALPEVFNLLQG